MGVIDTSKLPTGSRARAAFVAALEASDDRVENHFLEVKSGFDLNVKADRRKVVKFILGASHRDPVKASRHFDGYAVMVLGLPLDGVRGVEKFDIKDLAADIATFAGPGFTGWDVDLVPADDDRDIVLIIVDPPDGKIWPVLQSSDALVSGDIYIRAEGETRKIYGPELVALLGRAHAEDQAAKWNVEIAHTGVVHALVIDSAELRELAEWHAERLESQVDQRQPFASLGTAHITDRRSEQTFRDEVDAWRADSLEHPSSGVRDLAAQMVRPFELHIDNTTTTSLKEVRLDVTFEPPLVALYWQKQDDPGRLFPDMPLDWGRDSFLTSVAVAPAYAPPSFDSAIRIAVEEPAELVVELRRLHAQQSVKTPDEDVVLVMFADSVEDIPDEVTATWRLAAGDVNAVLSGHFNIAVEARDWRSPLHDTIARIRGDKSE